MYIFHLGFNRSGSKSLHAALNYLEISSLHHRYNNKRLNEIAKKNLSSQEKVFKKIDKTYFAYLDFNGFEFFKLLDKQYSNSKFIITLRPFKDWVESRERSNLINKSNFETNTKKLFPYYNNNLKQVYEYFQNDPTRLLTIKICEGQGWEILCPFLNKSIPSIPFPHQNKTVDKK